MGSTPRSIIWDELHLEVLQNPRDNSWLSVERKGKPNIVPYIMKNLQHCVTHNVHKSVETQSDRWQDEDSNVKTS